MFECMTDININIYTDAPLGKVFFLMQFIQFKYYMSTKSILFGKRRASLVTQIFVDTPDAIYLYNNMYGKNSP